MSPVEMAPLVSMNLQCMSPVVEPPGWMYTFFFYKKLSSEMNTQFLNVSSTRFSRGFFFQRDLRLFLKENAAFFRKMARQFLMHLEHEYSVS